VGQGSIGQEGVEDTVFGRLNPGIGASDGRGRLIMVPVALERISVFEEDALCGIAALLHCWR